MANASGKRFGKGMQGKSAGTGALTDIQDDAIKDNMVLSNRDKSQHPDARGLDSKWVQGEQLKEHETDKIPEQ